MIRKATLLALLLVGAGAAAIAQTSPRVNGDNPPPANSAAKPPSPAAPTQPQTQPQATVPVSKPMATAPSTPATIPPPPTAAAVQPATSGGPTVPTAVAAPTPQPAEAPTIAPFPAAGYSSYTLRDLGAANGFRLFEGGAEGGVDYSLRRDEVITAARLHLMLSNTAGFPSDTKLEVTLNGDSVGTVDIGSERHNATIVDLPIDPVLMTDYNRIGFKLLGVPLSACMLRENGPSLTIASQSAIDIASDRLPLASDLSILPMPFFDERDPRHVEATFVFADTPSMASLEASGIVASWLGALAGYRGVHFPAVFGSIPNGNVIIFASGNDQIPGLTIPQAVGPTVAMMPNPADPAGKLLLVMGRDANDLKVAARGLAIGGNAIKAGAVSAVAAIEPPERRSYDAPGWIPDNRPVKFSELATEAELQSHGMHPDEIRVDFKSAPDYFNWVDADIPMKIRFRVTPDRLINLPASRLDVALNNTSFKTVPLAGGAFPFSGEQAVHEGTVEIPPFLLTGRNRLTFYFDMVPSPLCNAVNAGTMVEQIDPDSTIDLSQSPHYTPMPNLSLFANAGYPFTRRPDLSQSAAVMPDQMTADDVEVFLEAMALFGESTGYPAYQVMVIHAADVGTASNRDLLLIGPFSRQPLLASWTTRTGLTIDGNALRAQPRGIWERVQQIFEWRNRRIQTSEVNDWLQGAQTGEGVLVGFRSPMDSQRSVVAITGSDSARVIQMSKTLQTSDRLPGIQDDLVLSRGDDVQSFSYTRRYETGSLPRWTWLRWNLSDQPIVIAILLFAACAALAAVAFVVLGVKARRRLQGANR